ncbi:MAG: AMIN domain-containing protein, partial [Acidobacteriota bacterium]|nr:AMIN domain-containing protein [Acidobacteriota bacterium]
MFRRLQRAAPVFLILPALAIANSGLIRVTSIRSWSHSDSTRVILETTGPFEFHSERAFNPDRLFFDVPRARPLLGGRRYATHQINDSLVRRVRIAETSPGTTRIVFDLTGPVTYKVLKLDTPDRMVIEVRPARPDFQPGPAYTSLSSLPFIYPPVVRAPRRYALLAATPPQFDPAPLQLAYIPDSAVRLSTIRPPHLANLISRIPQTQSTSTHVLAAPAAVSYDARPRASENASRSLTRALGLKVNRIVIDAGHGGHDDGT